MTLWDFLHEAGLCQWVGILIILAMLTGTVNWACYYFRRHR